MSKHFLVSGFESGMSLIGQDHHQTAMYSLDTAMNSKLLEKVDVCSMAIPHDCKSETAYAGTDDDFWPHPDSWFATYRPYKVVKGVLIIPVKGVLLHGVGITFGRYMTGYEYIVKAVQRGINDPDVEMILFHVDSPGGHVSGCFDTCDLVFSIEKPTVAFCADMACSAAYAIASSCDTIIGTQTCDTGHIGVLATFLDVNQALENEGVKFHYVTAPEGGHKADGNLGVPVSKAMLDRTQKEVNETYEIFVNVVQRGRPMTDAAIRETKALSFRKEASLSLGLIDKVASSVDIVAVALEATTEDPENQPAEQTASADQKEETAMTDEEKAALAKASKDEGLKAGADAAKARMSKILNSEEAKGRSELAQHFAFNTDLDADSAIAALKVSPVAAAPVDTPEAIAAKAKVDEDAAAKAKADEEAKKRAKGFDDTMSKHAPNLGGGAPTGDEDSEEDKAAKSLESSLALARSAGIGGYMPATGS